MAARRARPRAPSDLLPRSGDRVAAVGCGTSLFVAQAYAGLREPAGEGETDAFAASEAPDGRIYDVVLAISRSGTTTEVTRLLERPWQGARSVAICGVDDTPSRTPPTTGSSSASRTNAPSSRRGSRRARWRCCARVSVRTSDPSRTDGERALAADLPIDVRAFDHYVFLGRGWTVGLANEAALKMREASGAWAESYPAMEYRHGPISVAGIRSAVWPLGDVEPDLLRDVAATGATVVDHGLGPDRPDGGAHPHPTHGRRARGRTRRWTRTVHGT